LNPVVRKRYRVFSSGVSVDKPKFQTQLFINNEFVDALEGATFDVFNPFDNSLLAKVSEARPADIDRAVAAARKAFPAWAAMSPSDRGVLIGKLADAIEKDRDNLALIETLDTGHPIRDTRNLDVPRTVATFRYFGGMADKNEGSGHSGRHRLPELRDCACRSAWSGRWCPGTSR
jgi:acyl-CoA reductase-like NAD-dependent aldehyde dehydrogenase